ncbi:MAG: SRPBCC family protein [Solirubrobacteraceae bacterium]
MTGLWIAVGALAALIVAWSATLFLALAMGRVNLDLGLGRSFHQLGPITATIRAPRELVFEIIAAPYAGRASVAGIEVLAHSEHLAVARHHTRMHFYTAQTTEVIDLKPPTRVGFRHLTGPVPHAREQFVLEETEAGTELRYSGELGIDFYILGRIAGRHWVRPQWERVVTAHIEDVKELAEARAARRAARESSEASGDR